jgi:predicted MFS family arabinose efflux permease
VIALLVASTVGLLLFWHVERRAENPVVPGVLFRSRAFVVANILTLLLYGALAGVLFLLPFDLIERRGMAASAVGAVLLPFGLIIGLLSRPAGELADRYGARAFLIGGSLAVGVGAGALALSLENYLVGIFAPVILMGLGMAAVVTPLTTVVMNSAPDSRSGAASGVNNAASRIAGLIAVAALGAIAGQIFRWAGAPAGSRFGHLPPAGDPGRAPIEQAFQAAYGGATLVAAALCVLAAAAVLLFLTAEDCKA